MNHYTVRQYFSCFTTCEVLARNEEEALEKGKKEPWNQDEMMGNMDEMCNDVDLVGGE